MYTYTVSRLAISLITLSNIVSAAPIPDISASVQSTADAVLPVDFPDPSFIKGPDNNYYAFATSGNGKYVQIAQSASFQSPSWSTLPDDPLPDPGPWTDRTYNVWAPYVARTISGSFVMYYSAPPLTDPSKHCIGMATSTSITGPYTPSSSAFTCDLSTGGSIDPSIFHDPVTSTLYLLYKTDANSLGPGHNTPILLQPLSSDLTTPLSPPAQIFTSSPSASESLVEAPTMLYTGGTYYLLFSTNDYTTSAYDIRYVSSPSITGPFTGPQQVLLRTGDGNGVVGPGSCDVHDGMIAFHARIASSPSLERYMFAAEIGVGRGGGLVVQGMIS